MPCHAFTAKVLLLACGERIVSQNQLERLQRDDVIFATEAPPQFARAIEERQRALGLLTPRRDDADDADEHCSDAADADAADEPLDETEAAARGATVFVAEVAAARKLRQRAMRQVADLVEQAQGGRPLDLQPVRSTVGHVIASLRRNERAFASLLRLKSMDTYTYTHSINSCVLSIILGQYGGLTDASEQLGLGALVHDIGKMRLPEEILHKPGGLTAAEWDLVKQHPLVGLQLVGLDRESHQLATDAIAQHHERLDGSGYPAGLRDTEVSLAGRGVAIADVYDARTSDRPYHGASDPPEAMRWIFQRAGDLFDPQLVRAFTASVGLFPIGSLVRLGTGQLAVVASINPAAIRHPTVVIVSDLAGPMSEGPRLLDLAEVSASGGGDEIVGMADPNEFGIDVDHYLAMAPALPEVRCADLDFFA